MSDINQTPEEATLQRLEDQIAWYGQKAGSNQRRFKVMKGVTIISAAAIPVLTTAGIPDGRYIAAGLGVLIAIVEGVQQMNQYHANWASYRGTSENLKHEKYLYLAKAGPYLSAANPQAALAERVESLVSQEQSKWVSGQSEKPPSPTPPAR